MRILSVSFVLIALGIAANAATATRIKIGTVPDEYTPTDASTAERVSMQDFRFEVNPETVRARVVVEYTYPDQIIYSKDDDGGGPQRTVKQLPGLKYVPAEQAVVYEANGQETVCARVEERKGLFGRHLRVKNTGSCTVTTERTKHAEDDGWAIQRFTAIDAYFEVH
jgi:hypothetical protein